VMLCDDSAVQRGIMARILETDPGIRIVHRAGDGQAALSALAVTKPQVVLLDLEMPVMDGMTAIPLILGGLARGRGGLCAKAHGVTWWGGKPNLSR
jgi:two-component system chemotaxis response regulator CheB